MEQLGPPPVEIKDVSINDETSMIVVTYENDNVEEIPKGPDGYIKMHKEWLVDEPPHISDIYKVQMRDIILVSINNDQGCLNNINSFFVNENKVAVVKFIKYMRTRDLSDAKKIWTVRQ